MKKIIFLIILAFSFMTFDADAQSKKKSTSKKPTTSKSSKSSSKSKKEKKDDEGDEFTEETNFWKDKMMYGTFVNYPALGAGFFNMSLSPLIGYKVNKNITAGVLLKGNYTWYRNQFSQEPPVQLLDLGVGAFGRVKLFNVLFLHADVERTRYAYPDQNSSPIVVVKYPETSQYVGLGYISGFGKWKTELGVYYNTIWDSKTSIQSTPFDFRLGLTYNF